MIPVIEHLLKQQVSAVGEASNMPDACSLRMRQLSGRVNPYINPNLLPLNFLFLAQVNCAYN